MRANQRGVTLLEMMVTVALMSIVIGGIVMFLATHSRMSAGAFDRTDIQRSGRGALTVLEEKIGDAGLGLPKILAIKRYTNDDSARTNACAGSPRLEVASLDYQRQWIVASTAGDTVSGMVTLAAISDSPRNPTPGGLTDPEGNGGADIKLDAEQWLFIYTRGFQDLTNNFGPNRGHGMVQVGADRAKGAPDINIASTDYSGAQLALDLNPTSELNNTSGRSPVLLRADVAAFGVSCKDPDHPYLYWENNGDRIPVASNVATAGKGLTSGVGLSFRFWLDTTGPDGVPDGIGDAWDPTPAALTISPDPPNAEHDNVTAIQVTLVLRSDTPDPQLEAYRVETFTLLIQTPNIHTGVDVGDGDQLGRYLFIANTGI